MSTKKEVDPLLSAKTLGVLREVGRGEVTAWAMIALAGKQCAVMVALRPAAASARTELADHLGKPAGIKYIEAQCLFEAKAHTFVLPASVGGLAAKLQVAILAQTGTRYRIRVRGTDPADVDEAASDAPAEPATSGAAPPVPPPQPPAKAPAAAAPPKAPASAEKPAPAAGAVVDYARCRLAWEATRKKLQADLQSLKSAVEDEYRNTAGFAELASRLHRIDDLVVAFDEDLSGLLDRALNAQGAERTQYHRAAGELVRRFTAGASADPQLAQLDGNPFVPINTRQMLLTTLGELAKRLA